MIEFALAMPVLLTAGAYGIEVANLAVTHLRVSQTALNLADNTSRVGLLSPLNVTQLRESDVNDVMQGARLESGKLDLTTHGRVTLTSLENIQQPYDTAPVQRIHWQRCIGLNNASDYQSSYGTAPPAAGTTNSQANAGTTVTGGMGPVGFEVRAPTGTGVIFVEVNYRYQPLFGTMFIAPRRIHYIASFIVRDRRDFSQIYPSSGDQQTCDRFAA